LVYVPGVGAECRITGRFTTPVANSLQAAGFFTAYDGMFFGYDGTSFGVMHRHGGAPEIRIITITVASGSSATATITLNGAPYTAAVTNTTAQGNAHEIEAALAAGAAGALWAFQHIDNTVVCVARGAGARGGSYSVAVDGGTLAGTVAQTAVGATPTEDWTPRASWNHATPTWFDPSKGNLFKMEFAYLGYGPLKYHIFNPDTKVFECVHVVEWTNANQGVNLRSPSLRPGWVAASLGSTTALTVSGASAAAFLQGQTGVHRVFGGQAAATGVGTTETQVFSLQVRREFGSFNNNSIVAPGVLTVSTDSTKGAVFRVYRNPTVGGVTNHQYVDAAQSVCTYDTAGTTVSGGRLLGAYSIGPSGSLAVDISTGVVLQAGDELVISATCRSASAADMFVSLQWDERV
jgi:hypothetical protein